MKKNSVLNSDLIYINDNLSDQEKKKLNKKTILITGCYGFIGYYLMKYFIKYKEELKLSKIIGLDNFAYKKENEDQYKNKSFEFLKLNISENNTLEKLNNYTIDYAIHAASIASPTFYRKFPIQTLDANVNGLRNILEVLKDKNPEGVLFFSTSEIYGDPSAENIPTSETYNGNVSSLGPRACYDESKRFGETLCWVYNQEFNLPISIVRPFNNYGPGLSINDKRLPADLANNIIYNNDVILYSDGLPTRTYCYISDAVIGYIKAMLYGSFEVFNIGIDRPEISVLEFSKIFIEKGRQIFNYKKDLVFKKSNDKNYLKNNPNRRCPNIKKANEKLKYHPRIDPAQGIEKYLNFLKEINIK